jgi:hypothetical protein
MENKNTVAWTPIIELAVLAFTTLGTTITLHIHSDSKMEEFRKESLALHKDIHCEIQGMREEMKDFHGKLERQDAEFKAHILYQHQERNK